MNNEKVSLSMLLNNLTEQCSSSSMPAHVLVLSDTSKVDYTSHEGLLKVNDPDIGWIHKRQGTGFLMHPSLAIDSTSGLPIGISSVQLWSRPFNMGSKQSRKYTRIPIESKESNKWLVAAQESKSNLSSAKQITMVGDRESDIYEYFAKIQQQGIHGLVRLKSDRQLVNGKRISEMLAQQDWQGQLCIQIKQSSKSTKRKAKLSVRWCKVSVTIPPNVKRLRKGYAPSLELYALEVKEQDSSVPVGEEPAHWYLLTTHLVDNLEHALQIVRWYSWRWWIEDLFRTCKTQGLEIESSQFSTGIALKKLLVLCLEQALKILLMRQERLGTNQLSADSCFTPQEQACLSMLEPSLNGKTPKQQNPHQEHSLAWAVWLIARLGGWTPADLSKRPPGVITLSRGLAHFSQAFNGWNAALNLFDKTYYNSS